MMLMFLLMMKHVSLLCIVDCLHAGKSFFVNVLKNLNYCMEKNLKIIQLSLFIEVSN